jgi:hypothetical protein
MLKSLFTAHPSSVDETYGEHMAMATGFAVRMIAGGFACLIHAVLPFLFVRTGSETIQVLHDRMVVSRRRRAPVPARGVAAGAGR